jgi:dUTP pyrophosphatase
MKSVEIKIKKLSENAILPTKSHPGDAGWDLYASETVTLKAQTVTKVKTDIATQVGYGIWTQIEGRSGMASKGIWPCGGILDSCYRGEIAVMLYNCNKEGYTITKGDKIAQFVVRSQFHTTISEVSELEETERGDKGFGSSGV